VSLTEDRREGETMSEPTLEQYGADSMAALKGARYFGDELRRLSAEAKERFGREPALAPSLTRSAQILAGLGGLLDAASNGDPGPGGPAEPKPEPEPEPVPEGEDAPTEEGNDR
jgi:hypothetical protein